MDFCYENFISFVHQNKAQKIHDNNLLKTIIVIPTLSLKIIKTKIETAETRLS